jgi:hypothetical protein
MNWLLVLGFVSALVALVAFVGNQFGKLRAESFLYDFLNFISALGLLYYAYETKAYPFMLTNTVWALVSGADVCKYIAKKLTRQ